MDTDGTDKKKKVGEGLKPAPANLMRNGNYAYYRTYISGHGT